MANHEEQAKILRNMSSDELKNYELKLKDMVEKAKICRDAELKRREKNIKKLNQLTQGCKAEILKINKLKSDVKTLKQTKDSLQNHNKAIINQLEYLQDISIQEFTQDPGPELDMENKKTAQLDEDFKKWKEDFNVANIEIQTKLALQSKEFFVKEQEKVKQEIETVKKQMANDGLELEQLASNIQEVVDDYNIYCKPNYQQHLKELEGSVENLENECDFSKQVLLMSQGFDTVDSTKYENGETSDSEVEI